MNYLDVAIIAPTFIYIIKGFSNGLIKEIASLGGNIDRFVTKHVVKMLKNKF